MGIQLNSSQPVTAPKPTAAPAPKAPEASPARSTQFDSQLTLSSAAQALRCGVAGEPPKAAEAPAAEPPSTVGASVLDAVTSKWGKRAIGGVAGFGALNGLLGTGSLVVGGIVGVAAGGIALAGVAVAGAAYGLYQKLR